MLKLVNRTVSQLTFYVIHQALINFRQMEEATHTSRKSVLH